jgi:mono/diheme cytochrome c family protein
MRSIFVAAAMAVAGAAQAVQPAELLAGYESAARRETPAYTGASASRGEQFFNARHGAEWSCASCHGAAGAAQGKHAKTGKAIAPLSPIANAERFTDAAKAEKWFKRNCNDVLGRACTSAEKGDVLAFLLKGRP